MTEEIPQASQPAVGSPDSGAIITITTILALALVTSCCILSCALVTFAFFNNAPWQ